MNLEQILMKMTNININETQILDCTLQDGGYYNDRNFDKKKLRVRIL